MSLSLAFLQNLGLNEKEIFLYQLLLKHGDTPVSLLITESQMKRPTVYKLLHSLKEKGFITEKDMHKKLHVAPESPVKLLEIAERKYHDAKSTYTNLEAVVPQLISSYIAAVEKPVVRMFEGFEGLKELYKDTLKDKQPIFAVLQTNEVDPQMYEWLEQYYGPKRTKEKIHAKVIVSTGKLAKDYHEKDVQTYRTSILVPQDTFPFKHEVNIHGDKVAFMHWKKGENLLGILIENKQIAQTMKAFFDLAWTGAENSTLLTKNSL
jgi:sugar-specific transcriptional regulator TrmB